jgi:hypothetical protein
LLFNGGRLGIGLLCRVETIHIGLVMFLVVESHDLLRDIGLKGLY